MRKSAFWILAVVVTLVLVGAGVAQAASEGKTASRTKAPAVKHLTGTVVSVNAEKKTVMVKQIIKGMEREQSFTVEKDAVPVLTHLKAGERVRVDYVENSGQLMAQSIGELKHSAKK